MYFEKNARKDPVLASRPANVAEIVSLRGEGVLSKNCADRLCGRGSVAWVGYVAERRQKRSIP
jgi:hypothetical protein